jgi:3-oxoacyl-[acyl-carrier-protein] synthase II
VLREAIMDACLAADSPYSAARTACVLGTTLHGMRRAGEFLRGASASVLAGFLAAPVMRDALDGLSVGGPRLTTCAACSSGLASVELAITLLRTHEADVVIAGGYDAISEYAYAGFDSLRLIAPGPARPFCRGREGMNIAEGYAIIILERAPDAARRGARALASVLAVASSSDCHHLTQPHPEGEGAQRAIHAALHEAGLEPSAIGMVAAHATSTPNNDAAEYNALNAVFGEGLARVPVVAFKSHLGHTLGGAGAAELVLSALSLRDQAVPPTANVTAKQVEYPGLNLNTASLSPARIDATLSLSLGFGGANSCAILGPAPGRTGLTPPARTTRDVYITGVGVVAPAAVGNQAFASLLTGAPRPLLIDPGALDEAAIAHLLQARRVRRMSDYVKLTLASAAVAFEDARINDTSAFGRDCAAILGTTHGSAGYSETYYRQIVAEGIVGANPMLFAEGVPNAGAAQLSTMFGIKGSCQTIIGSRTADLLRTVGPRDCRRRRGVLRRGERGVRAPGPVRDCRSTPIQRPWLPRRRVRRRDHSGERRIGAGPGRTHPSCCRKREISCGHGPAGRRPRRGLRFGGGRLAGPDPLFRERVVAGSRRSHRHGGVTPRTDPGDRRDRCRSSGGNIQRRPPCRARGGTLD